MLPLTPETLAAAYDYLKSTPPFSKWNLPESDEVLFKVTRVRGWFGRYRWNGKKHTIEVSSASIGQTQTLLRYMAHEMVHLHLEDIGMESRTGGPNTHNAAFRVLAAHVCKVHGFDPKAFY